MKEKFRRFMIGRYGADSLNQFLCVASLACLVVAMISKFQLFYYLGLALLFYSYFRMFSRNISARTAENYKFYNMKQSLDSWINSRKSRWAGRKQYRYYACPQCRQKLRVPRGRGRIQISCPRCGNQFIKKS
ncbi:MAG: hypothetical protein IJ347_03130 [Faecalibacterium sp.]|nr:hypothetical protein [Faecalibacterium sp.]